MGILSVFRRLRRKEGSRETAPPSDESPSAPASVRVATTASREGALTLVRPTVTEKATLLASQGRYVFRVTPSATKNTVRRSVEQLFGVRVEHVRVIGMPGKRRRRGQIVGSVPRYRKAIVTLRKGERIDLAGGTPFEKARASAPQRSGG